MHCVPHQRSVVEEAWADQRTNRALNVSRFNIDSTALLYTFTIDNVDSFVGCRLTRETRTLRRAWTSVLIQTRDTALYDLRKTSLLDVEASTKHIPKRFYMRALRS